MPPRRRKSKDTIVMPPTLGFPPSPAIQMKKKLALLATKRILFLSLTFSVQYFNANIPRTLPNFSPKKDCLDRLPAHGYWNLLFQVLTVLDLPKKTSVSLPISRNPRNSIECEPALLESREPSALDAAQLLDEVLDSFTQGWDCVPRIFVNNLLNIASNQHFVFWLAIFSKYK